MAMRRRRRTIIVVAASALLLFLAWFAYSTVQMVMNAEYSYQATNWMFEVVENYVAEHRAWPKSWQDIELSARSKRDRPLRWPRDSGFIKRHVIVDFDVCLENVAKQNADPERFSAIRPTFPGLPVDKSVVASLLAVLRKAIAESKQRKT